MTYSRASQHTPSAPPKIWKTRRDTESYERTTFQRRNFSLSSSLCWRKGQALVGRLFLVFIIKNISIIIVDIITCRSLFYGRLGNTNLYRNLKNTKNASDVHNYYNGTIPIIMLLISVYAHMQHSNTRKLFIQIAANTTQKTFTWKNQHRGL